jgi:hypothetical protein
MYIEGLTIINELRLLPLEITELNNYFKNNIIIEKKFYLNSESKNIMRNIKNIKIIVMDNNFNEKFKIPKGVKDITFGDNFNRKVNLPKSLKRVTFGKNFNKKIKYPSGLEIINFGKSFNQLIEYPKGLELISFSNSYDKPFQTISGIKEIYVYFDENNPIILPLLDEDEKITLIKSSYDDIKFYVRWFSLFGGNWN